MKYEEALSTVSKYQYLLNKDIIEKTSGTKHKVDYITIIPVEGIRVYNNDWLHPLREVFAKYLSDKDCNVHFIVDFITATSSGISLTQDNIEKNYMLPASNEA